MSVLKVRGEDGKWRTVKESFPAAGYLAIHCSGVRYSPIGVIIGVFLSHILNLFIVLPPNYE